MWCFRDLKLSNPKWGERRTARRHVGPADIASRRNRPRPQSLIEEVLDTSIFLGGEVEVGMRKLKAEVEGWMDELASWVRFRALRHTLHLIR